MHKTWKLKNDSFLFNCFKNTAKDDGSFWDAPNYQLRWAVNN